MSIKVPKHIAIIVDGNRRWARARGLPDIKGHYKAFERIKPIVEYCADRGVKVVTFWAWSTENWRRNKKFILDFMKFMRDTLKRQEFFEEIKKSGGKLHLIGDPSKFPKDILEKINEYLLESKPKKKVIDVNIALGYGGRDEIVRAVRKIIKEKIPAQEVDEETISARLDTAGQQDPDLMIRTGGEIRTSGYLLWQLNYAEFYFTETLFPDFTPEELDKAILEFSRRHRRFGGD